MYQKECKGYQKKIKKQHQKQKNAQEKLILERFLLNYFQVP